MVDTDVHFEMICKRQNLYKIRFFPLVARILVAPCFEVIRSEMSLKYQKRLIGIVGQGKQEIFVEHGHFSLGLPLWPIPSPCWLARARPRWRRPFSLLVVRCRRKIPSGQEPSAVAVRLPEPERGYHLSASHYYQPRSPRPRRHPLPRSRSAPAAAANALR